LLGVARFRDAFGRTKAEQDTHALPVLLGAFEQLARAWIPNDAVAELRARDQEPPGEALALWEALAASSCDESFIDVEYARRLIRKLEGDFNRWEAHPLRTHEEVLRLVRKAIVLAGGEPPPLPLVSNEPARLRGGWTISSRRVR
jgi:hypothetical protein